MPERSIQVLATLLNVTPRRVRQLVEEGIVVKRGRGDYDVAASVKNYTRVLQERAFGAGTADLQIERGRLLRAQADRAEMLLEELRGALIPVEELERTLTWFATVIRSRLLTLPRQIAPRVSPANPREAQEILDAEIRLILEELADDRSLPSWLQERRARRRADGPDEAVPGCDSRLS